MSNDEFFKDYRAFVSFQQEHYGKSILFENEHLLVGLNCLEPGQEMDKHAHQEQCRFYVVLEGTGHVWVGDQQEVTKTGMVVWVPPGYSHRLVNTGEEKMVLLVGFTLSRTD